MAVRPIRVGVEIAAHVADRDQCWQRVRERGIDLAVILTQLRGDRVHAERRVDLFFAPRRDLLAARLGTDAIEAVFVQQQLPFERVATQPDVVLLRPGEETIAAPQSRASRRGGRSGSRASLDRVSSPRADHALDRRGTHGASMTGLASLTRRASRLADRFAYA